MTYNIIATGSTGNAVTINDEILIDCGVPFKTLEPYIKSLKLVLLTHVHGDHFKPSTVAALHKARPAVRWGCCEWMVEPLLEVGVDKRVIDVYELGRVYRYDGMCNLRPIGLAHNVPNCGYKIIEHKGMLESLFYATDTGTLDGVESARNFDYYLIEANHTRAEVEARIEAKRKAGEFAYEYRAAQNHLSQEQAMDWLAENMGPNSKYLFLHQHKERNIEKQKDKGTGD